jgi:hypothetical protein
VFIYWALFAVIAAGALLNQHEERERARWLLLICASLPTVLMIGLRWKVGPDWDAYLDIFGVTRFWSMQHIAGRGDWGFGLLLWLLHRAEAPFWILNLIIGVIFVGGLTAFCRRQPNPWLAYLVAFPYLVVVVGLSGLRQSAALGFLFFALNEFERGRLIRFTLLLVIGASFHASAVVMLPICLLSYTRNNLQRAVLLLVAALLASHFLADTFAIYARRYGSTAIQSSGVLYRVAMNGLAAVLFLGFRNRFTMEEHERRLWRNFSLLTFGLAAILLFVPSSTAVDRLLLYLFPLQLVVLSRVPLVLGRERQAAGQLSWAIIVYSAAIQAVFLLFGVAAAGYVPYRTIFS